MVSGLSGDSALEDDLIRPFQIEGIGVRGRLVRLGPTVDEIIRRHDYPLSVSHMLGQAIALSAALAGALKFDGVFSVQAKGEGPVRMLVADFASPGKLRGYAQYDRKSTEMLDAAMADGGISIPRLLGAGHIAFTVDQGEETDRYQGIVSLEGATLADCAHHYFRESEQIRAAIHLAARQAVDQDGAPRWRAGALMIQRLPEGDPALMARGAEVEYEDFEDEWRHVVSLFSTVTDDELLNQALTPDDLLFRLFHEDGVRVFQPTWLAFGCRCSRGRAEGVLSSLSQDALQDLIVDGKFVVTCEFCNSSYDFQATQFMTAS